VAQLQDFELLAEGYRRLAVHAGRTAWVQAHPAETVAALRAVRAGVRWLYDAANQAEAIALLAREINVAEPIARQTYALLVEQLKPWSPISTCRPRPCRSRSTS
jgi:ABC-type nitrate/sulfonate/bicarbonate transport system substrate-binding protein